MKLDLKWKGPLQLFNMEKKWSDVIQKEFENKKGIYLFGYKHNDIYIINYVGKSDNILKRMREHIVNTLGGAYSLLDIKKIENDCETEKKYQLENDLYIKNYLEKFEEYSGLAFKNITSSFVFITLPQESEFNILKLIESAFINFFRLDQESKNHILNDRLSKFNDTGEEIIINSEFNKGIQILGNPINITY